MPFCRARAQSQPQPPWLSSPRPPPPVLHRPSPVAYNYVEHLEDTGYGYEEVPPAPIDPLPFQNQRGNVNPTGDPTSPTPPPYQSPPPYRSRSPSVSSSISPLDLSHQHGEEFPSTISTVTHNSTSFDSASSNDTVIHHSTPYNRDPYFDLVVGNSVIRDPDPDPSHLTSHNFNYLYALHRFPPWAISPAFPVIPYAPYFSARRSHPYHIVSRHDLLTSAYTVWLHISGRHQRLPRAKLPAILWICAMSRRISGLTERYPELMRAYGEVGKAVHNFRSEEARFVARIASAREEHLRTLKPEIEQRAQVVFTSSMTLSKRVRSKVLGMYEGLLGPIVSQARMLSGGGTPEQHALQALCKKMSSCRIWDALRGFESILLWDGRSQTRISWLVSWHWEVLRLSRTTAEDYDIASNQRLLEMLWGKVLLMFNEKSRVRVATWDEASRELIEGWKWPTANRNRADVWEFLNFEQGVLEEALDALKEGRCKPSTKLSRGRGGLRLHGAWLPKIDGLDEISE